MKAKITKRDILFFFLGIILCVVLDLIFNWTENVNDFQEGFNSAFEKHEETI